MELSKAMFLIGLSVAGILFLDPKLSRAKDDLNKSSHQYLYRYRAWCTWWRQRQSYLELETAIQQAIKEDFQNHSEWAETLQQLREKRNQKVVITTLINNFESGDWKKRFIIRQILRKISQDTHEVTTNSSSWPLCADCFIQVYPYEISLTTDEVYVFYGCRKCRQYERLLDNVDSVIAVLDVNMQERWVQKLSTLQVNWLKHRAIFDFDRVEIARTIDEDVERFAIQVGNDTDELRQRRYRQMNCVLKTGSELSDNTVRILQKTFDNVVIIEK
jgi:hypothetical protein